MTFLELQEEKKRHEYLLMEMRLSNEDLKTFISEKYEKRISSLEHWRTWVNGITAAFGIVFTFFKIGIIKIQAKL